MARNLTHKLELTALLTLVLLASASAAVADPPPPPPLPPDTTLSAGPTKIRATKHRLSVSIQVSDQLGQPASGSIRCAARISTGPLRIASRGLASGGTATCVFALPRRRTRTRVTGSITVTSASAAVTRDFAAELHR